MLFKALCARCFVDANNLNYCGGTKKVVSLDELPMASLPTRGCFYFSETAGADAMVEETG